MNLDDDDPAINCFEKLGENPIKTRLVNGHQPSEVKLWRALFVMSTAQLAPKQPALRWELFR